MSSRGNDNGGGGAGGAQSISSSSSSIPGGYRKMVQSLKEIVNCPELEIYAMLKECNMDPNETVNRLLSLDPFREVKSKREKKKENKDTTETRSRGVGNSSSRGRSGTDRYVGRGGSTQFSSSEPGALHGKPAYKKENGMNLYTSYSSSASGVEGNNANRRPPAISDSFIIENKVSAIDAVDGTSSASQPSPGYQSAWVGVPGQVSMADIVKMGRPHIKASSMSNLSHHGVNQHHLQRPTSTVSHHDLISSEDNPPNDEWPVIERLPTASVPSAVEAPIDSELHPDASNLPFDRINRNSQYQTDEVRATKDGAVENLSANYVGSASVKSQSIEEDNSGGASLFDNDLYRNMSSYQPHNQTFEHEEDHSLSDEDVALSVSSVAANLQQLSVQEECGAPPQEDGPSVVIPNHLQVQTADCSHLSFGSFGTGFTAPFSGPSAPRPLKTNLEEAPTEASALSVEHSDTRNPEYYGDESIRTAADSNIVHRAGGSAGSYDSPSGSQAELLKQQIPEVAHENQYTFPSSTPGYNYENAQQLNNAFAHSHTSSQTQNLAPFSNVMAYTNSLSSTLLAANAHPVRDSDLSYLPFPMTQSMPTKYGNTVSSIGSSTISMPEALKTVGFSSTQPTPQTLPGASVATGPALPQHLAVHPYSQPTLQLGPFANMIGYPFLPQSYTYMPSAFQQAFAGNSTYHQSLAPVLPQYKNSVSVNSLPQSAAIASGYGAFGSSTNIPGNFQMNQPAAPGGTTIGYEDVMGSQYKDSNHMISPQQNENSAMWLHGAGSRTMSAVPANTYYSIHGQSQQPAGFRQAQQPSQSYGTLGYPNFYPSQTGISLEHQQQNPRDGSLVGSQAQPKQSQQIWQNSY